MAIDAPAREGEANAALLDFMAEVMLRFQCYLSFVDLSINIKGTYDFVEYLSVYFLGVPLWFAQEENMFDLHIVRYFISCVSRIYNNCHSVLSTLACSSFQRPQCTRYF